ncbi:MAG TPA: GNAT family N-acetyltransferase [Candidatus Limnocylindria bacterium]|nr:GNAT family N-acetyltransferase [Candidatus Limnocylindria bacterium]
MIEAPVDLRIRPFDPDRDLADVVRVLNAENEADDVDERETPGDFRSHVAHASEQFDARRDIGVGELGGRIVAVAGQDWVDTRDGALREHRLWGAVAPDYRRRGIGTAMLADNERRAAALASTHDTDRPHTYAGWASDGRPGARLLEASGYELVRWFFDMVRPDLEDLPAPPPLPDGLELRPVTPDLYTVVWQGNREAFRDHWGGSDESEAAMRRFLDAPHRDPTLWLVAFDGDEVAAGVFNGIYPEQDAALGIKRGWLDSVFTRRPWRRRGLARALILRSLVLLRERGMTSAALGVDADNPLGALGLYESAGFVVHDRFTAWRKPMEARS